MKNLVSIIMCSYNAEKFIDKTLESILNQTYVIFEFLILDNNSEDNTVKIIKSYQKKDNRIKLFENNINLWAYWWINYLLKKAKWEYISIVDHDDIYHPEKTSIQVDFLEKNMNYLWCGWLSIKYYEKNWKLLLIKKNGADFYTNHPSLMFRNIKWLYYDISIKYRTDSYFMRYILCNNIKKIYTIQKPLYLSRVRADWKNYNKIWRNFQNMKTYSKNEWWLFFLIKEILKKYFNLYGLYIRIFWIKISIDEIKQNNYLRKFLQYIKLNEN